MSRWNEQFEAHPFQEVWRLLKSHTEEVSVEDETVITSVQDIARLKKAIAYIDGIIKGLDPELVPLATWDNFNSQAAAADGQINSYNSNKNIAHINKANAHVDNLLTYVRPYMMAEGKIAKTLNSSIKQYAKTIDEHGELLSKSTSKIIREINDYKEKGDALFKEIEETNKIINEYNEELFGNEEATGVKQEIEELAESITEKHTKILELYNEMLIGDEENLSTKKSVLMAKEAIDSEKDNIVELLKSVETNVENLNAFHEKIFGVRADDDEEDGGLSGDLKVLMEDMTKFEKEQKSKYKTLNEQIEGLLPGATNAGLATAYRDMKGTFDKPIKQASTLFYLTISALVVISLFVAIKSIGVTGIEFIEVGDWSAVLKGLVNKLPLYIPVVWLAFYATRRRSENQRLQQEYAHKESLAKSYNSYKKQILALGDEDKEMQKVFIMKTIDAIAYNASSTLDGKHGDKMPVHEMIEKTVESIMIFKKD